MNTKIDSMRKNLMAEASSFDKLSTIEEKIKFLLRYAILAPSTHNSQPWLFKIKGNECLVYFDPKLKLKYADPKCRDLYISIGCAIENLILASKYFGLIGNIKYVADDNEDNLVAIVSFDISKGEPSLKEIIDMIIRRVNSRGPLIQEKVDDSYLQKIKKISNEYSENGIELKLIEDRGEVEKIAKLTQRGMKMAHANRSFREEMSNWIVSNYTSRREGMIGYSMNMPGIVSIFLSKIVKFFNMGPIMGKINYISISKAPLVCIVTAPGLEAETWIKMGRQIERLMLEFQKDGYCTSIYLASIEMGDLHKEVQKIINSKDIPQFAFTVGKMNKKLRTTPRHYIESKLIK